VCVDKTLEPKTAGLNTAKKSKQIIIRLRSWFELRPIRKKGGGSGKINESAYCWTLGSRLYLESCPCQ